MKPRLNQPAQPPRGRFHCPPAERLATTFATERCTIRFAMTLPPGVLVRLLARQNRLLSLSLRNAIGFGLGQGLGTVNPGKFRGSSIGAKRR